MQNSHEKDATRRTLTRATAIAVAAGLVFTTAQIAQAQDPTESTTGPAPVVQSTAPAATSVEPVVPATTSVAAEAAPTTPVVAEVVYPGDYVADSLKILEISSEAKPDSETGLVDWTDENAPDNAGFLSSPNALAPRDVELTITAEKGLEGIFDKFTVNGDSFLDIRAALPKTQAAGLTGVTEINHSDFSYVAADNSVSKQIQDTAKVEVGEDGRELKISYTTPAGVGAFVGVESPGYFTTYDKDAKLAIDTKITGDVAAASVVTPEEKATVEAKADKDYKAPESTDRSANVAFFVNDENAEAPTGATADGTVSKVEDKDQPVLVKGEEATVSVLVENTSEKANLVDPYIALPDGTVKTENVEIEPGATKVFVYTSKMDTQAPAGIQSFGAGTAGERPVTRSFAATANTANVRTIESGGNGDARNDAVNEQTPVESDNTDAGTQPQAEAPAPAPANNEEQVQEFQVQEPAQNEQYAPTWLPSVEVKRNQTIRMTRGGTVPAGTTFSIEDDTSNIVDDIDADGNITIQPVDRTDLGTTKFTVRATYPDRTADTQSVTVRVVAAAATTTTTPTSSSASTSPTSTRSEAQEVQDIVEQIGEVLAVIGTVLAPILGVAGLATGGSNSTAASSRVSTARPSEPVTSPNTAVERRASGTTTSGNNSTNSGTVRSNTTNSGTSRVTSGGTARTTTRTTVRRAATSNSTRTTRATRATTSSRTANSRLANTGANTWSIVAIAMLLIALAGMFFQISRRSREI